MTSSLTLTFLLALVPVICAEEQTLGDIIAGKQEETEFLRGLLLRTEDLGDGYWPVTDAYQCDLVNTRDSGTPEEIMRAAKGPIDNGDQCGINIFEMAARKEKKANRKRSKRSVTKRESSDLSKALRELGVELKNFLKSEKHTRDAKTLRTMRSKMRQRSALLKQTQLTLQRRDGEIESRIVGGEESTEGKYPWLVAVGKKSTGLRCGGTLINKRWVVTAAHCFQDQEMPCSFNLRLGSFNWVNDPSGHHEDVEPELIVKHPDYDPNYLGNDIALVKLSRDLDLSADSFINSVCLIRGDVKTGDTCVAAGWGARYEDDHDLPQTVQEVELPVLEKTQCNFDVSDKQMCAGSVDGGIDTCQGDSGGPLMVNRKDKWYLAGVTSFGNGCARAEWPGIYTDVNSYTDYIKSVLNRYS